MRRETVGAHIVAPVASGGGEETVGGVLARLATEKPASMDLVCMIDARGRFGGAAPLGRLFQVDGATSLRDAVNPAFPKVGVEDDQEVAASLALHHGVDALPVVDRAGKLLGVMPPQALLQVLRQEHVEDLHVLAGIRREATQARRAIEDPPSRRARHRLPWLFAGLAGSALATAVMAGFGETLEKTVAVAYFIPGLVYLADAIGTQSEAIAVRGLSLSRVPIGNLLARELRTGMLIGAALALVALPLMLIGFGDLRLAAAVSTSIVVAGCMASVIGIGLPWLFSRGRLDPAYGSGPIATVIQDVLSILVYFGVLRLFGV
jgi:magnesium transporter